MMQRERPSCRVLATRKIAVVAQDGFERYTPRDTRRLSRAWSEACGEAGGELRPLPALQPSRSAGVIYDRIVGQWLSVHRRALALEKKIAFLFPTGKKMGPTGQKMASDLRWLKRRDARLKEEVDKYLPVKEGPVIVIGGRGLNPYATVRTAVYGGRGFIKDSPAQGVAVMYLWNREPHASIVNANIQLNATVGRFVRMAGATPVGAAYLKRLKIARARSVAQFDAMSK